MASRALFGIIGSAVQGCAREEHPPKPAQRQEMKYANFGPILQNIFFVLISFLLHELLLFLLLYVNSIRTFFLSLCASSRT
jgi:hypothetical protein